MPSIWGKRVSNLRTGCHNTVEERPQNQPTTQTNNKVTVQNPLFTPISTVLFTHSFPQEFFQNYHWYIGRFTHYPHPLLLLQRSIN